jgi:type II secretion system protein C
MILEKLKGLRFPDFHFSSVASQAMKIRPVLIILIITCAMYASVGILYKLVSLKLIRPKIERTVIAQSATDDTIKKESLDFYKVIPERNLFGSTDKTIAGKLATGKTGVGEQDITQLLDLKGTVVGDVKYCFAIIDEKGKNKERLYKVGDTIIGAKLVRIMRNAVVLKTGDKEKILKMAEMKETPILPSPPTSSPERDARTSMGTITVNKSDIGSDLKDMGTLLRQAQVRPYFSGGIPDGFMVSNIRQGGIYQKMGLIDGDILQGINNRKMQSADDMVELYNTLKSGSGLTMRIKRQGKEEILNYDFR